VLDQSILSKEVTLLSLGDIVQIATLLTLVIGFALIFIRIGEHREKVTRLEQDVATLVGNTQEIVKGIVQLTERASKHEEEINRIRNHLDKSYSNGVRRPSDDQGRS
jgi:hypothetical protein